MADSSEMDVDDVKSEDEKTDFPSLKTEKETEDDPKDKNGCSENRSDFKKPVFLPPNSEKTDSTPQEVTATTITPTTSVSVLSITKDKYGDKNESPDLNKKSGNGNSDSSLSPAELAKQRRSAIPYKEPSWGGLSPRKYSFDVLKNGRIIDNVDLTEKSYVILGRLPTCDVTLEHPSLSRYHACIQNCATPTERYKAGWYLYDLDSTHGTWINKNRVPPKTYHRIRVGHVIKFGGSTRLFILQGPEDDQEEESELSVTELKMQREKHKRETELLRQEEEEDPNELIKRDDGCMWGMDMANVTDEGEANPFALELDESFYIEDPKKALKNYLDREGFDAPEYEISNEGPGKYRCSIELPVDDSTGHPLVAVATVTGKKREAVEACALEACRILDRQGVLRAATHESRKRKKKNWEENDFYDSDEDTFLDRTGTIEKKREQRMKKAGKLDDKAETYESLTAKHTEVKNEIEEIEEKLEKAKADAAALESSDDMDALDAYMNSIKSGVMDTKTRLKLKRRLLELRPQEQQLRKLVNLTRPASLPELKPFVYQPKTEMSTTGAKAKPLPIFGKMKGGNQPKVTKVFTVSLPPSLENRGASSEEEEEEDEEEDDEESKDQRESPMETSEKDLGSSESKKRSVKDKESPRSAPTQDQKSEENKKRADKPHRESDSIPSETTSCHKTEEPPSKKNPVLTPSETSSMKKQKSSSQRVGGLAFSRGLLLKEQKKLSKTDANFDEDTEKVVWLPPTNQSGDGRTSLNEKYGY